jgi:uncharacterized protein (DUF58 family)
VSSPAARLAAEAATGNEAVQPVVPDLTWRLQHKVVIEGAAAGLALLMAAVFGDYVLIAFCVPLAVASVFGLTRRRTAPTVAVELRSLVTSPGEPILLAVTVASRQAMTCCLTLQVPSGLEAEGATSWEFYLAGGAAQELECQLVSRRPGRFSLGSIDIRVTDPTACLVATGALRSSAVAEVRPLASSALAVVRPERVRATAGDRLARLAADGIEMADVREQPEGALGRRINWRATARRQVTCVNLQHPERSTDVVLLTDTFSESEIPNVVSVAISLAESYSKRHDRLGLVSFGGVLDWVEPGTGPAHLERVRGALLASEVFFSYAWKTADIIPRRLFPVGCLVLAISPLGDERFIGTLASLRSRGIDLAVVELSPPALGHRRPGGRVTPVTLAARVVTLEREHVRRRFWAWGVPVVPISAPEEISGALAEIAAFRRSHVSRAAGAR